MILGQSFRFLWIWKHGVQIEEPSSANYFSLHSILCGNIVFTSCLCSGIVRTSHICTDTMHCTLIGLHTIYSIGNTHNRYVRTLWSNMGSYGNCSRNAVLHFLQVLCPQTSSRAMTGDHCQPHQDRRPTSF